MWQGSLAFNPPSLSSCPANSHLPDGYEGRGRTLTTLPKLAHLVYAVENCPLF